MQQVTALASTYDSMYNSSNVEREFDASIANKLANTSERTSIDTWYLLIRNDYQA